MDKKRRFYSIMIVPHDAHGKPVSIKIPASWVYTAVWLALFSFVLVGSSFVYSTILSRRLVGYSESLSKNQQQQKVITSFSSKTNKVTQAINELAQKENELRKLLGLKSGQTKMKLTSSEARADKISLDLELAGEKLAERKKSLEELKEWVNVVRSRFASTPSTWPIYGRVVSSFGYRSSPWRGFHAGIDIHASYGAAARATADGVITYIGWRSGYGKTVEISHGNGASTLYAHNSGYAVNVGQEVKRGQIVCYVGTTGWTTGPHLHYEVRRWGAALNPVAYLDLNVLSASRLWR